MYMALVWSVGSASHLVYAQTNATFTIQISLENPEVENSNDEVVVVKMKNVSEHVIEYGLGSPFPLFKLQVQDEHGNIVKENAYGMKAHGTDPHQSPRAFSGISSAHLKIGETLKREIELGKEYALSVPGVYRVTASRVDSKTLILVTSNEIQFTVLPK